MDGHDEWETPLQAAMRMYQQAFDAQPWYPEPKGYAPLNYSAADEAKDRALLVRKLIEADIVDLVGEKTAAMRRADAIVEEFIRHPGKYYRLHHDFETFSEHDLPSVGTDRYSRHASTEVLMCAYAFNDDRVKQWVPAEGEEMPVELDEAMDDRYAIKFAWNKPFEWSIWANVLGRETAHTLWRDPMVMALACALPGSLAKAGNVIGMPEDKKKDARGKLLIRTFCTPRKPTKTKPHTRVLPHHEPVKWEEFKEYNVTDVEAERGIYKKLKPYDLPKEEWELWVIDQKINQAGIPINMAAVDNANEIYEWVLADRLAEMNELTGLANANAAPQLLPWLQERGYPFEDCQKGHIQRGWERIQEQLDAGEGEHDEELHLIARVLELRLETSRTAPTKYAALQRAVDREHGVIRNTFQFAGAGRTWRWGGRLYQPQNLAKPSKYLEKWVEQVVDHVEHLDPWSFDQVFTYPRTNIGGGKVLYSSPMDALATCVRPVAQAPEGMLFVDADLNAIENRVLGWIADCPKILRVFELDRDPYIDFATYLFGGEYDDLFAEYKAGDSFKRTISKPGVLGCGYRLGPGEKRINNRTGEVEGTGLLGYAWNMGVKDFTPEQAILSVKVFREQFEEVVDFWYKIEDAAKKCVRTGEPTRYRMVRFDTKGPFLRMQLPSGRYLHYCRPRIEERETPWGAMKMTLTYEGEDDRKQWVRITTHGGKLTENFDQATARDLLGHGMKLAYNEGGIDLRLHVHDQLVGLAPAHDADRQLKVLQDCMGVLPIWGMAGPEWKDLPLGSAGFTSKIFMKD